MNIILSAVPPLKDFQTIGVSHKNVMWNIAVSKLLDWKVFIIMQKIVVVLKEGKWVEEQCLKAL